MARKYAVSTERTKVCDKHGSEMKLIMRLFTRSKRTNGVFWTCPHGCSEKVPKR